MHAKSSRLNRKDGAPIFRRMDAELGAARSKHSAWFVERRLLAKHSLGIFKFSFLIKRERLCVLGSDFVKVRWAESVLKFE